jgi:hypothetical protein
VTALAGRKDARYVIEVSCIRAEGQRVCWPASRRVHHQKPLQGQNFQIFPSSYLKK